MMSPDRIVLFLEKVFEGFHRKNQRPLSVLVASLVTVGKVGIASLGRAIRSRVSFKQKIEQVDRFLANDNVHVSDWCATGNMGERVYSKYLTSR